jgi:hypothetical protein
MGGAPTGKWDTMPEHLREDQPYDIRQAEAKLKVRRPGVPEVVIPLEKTMFVIGRSPNDVDLVLDDETVSKKHARLTMDARGYFRLEDLGSQNKIRFKNRPVRPNRVHLPGQDEPLPEGRRAGEPGCSSRFGRRASRAEAEAQGPRGPLARDAPGSCRGAGRVRRKLSRRMRVLESLPVSLGLLLAAVPSRAEPAPGAALSQFGPYLVADVAEKVTPAVVNIATERTRRINAHGPMEGHPMFREFFGPSQPQRELGVGSGVVISADGYIVTNHHVIDGADEIKVVFPDKREFKAKLIGTDKPSDVALLKIEAKGLASVPFGRRLIAEAWRVRARDRQPVRRRSDGHLGHRLRQGPLEHEHHRQRQRL